MKETKLPADREVRFFKTDDLDLEERAKGKLPVIVGHAAVFNSLSSDLGGFREVIRPGAFAASIARGDDVRALVDHDPGRILARTKSRTLTLSEDDTGLLARIQPADTTAGRDIAESISRGDVDAMSFGFKVVTQQWRKEGDQDIRELHEVELFDVSPVSYPAYPATDVSIAKRSLSEWQKRTRYADDPNREKRKKDLTELTEGL